MKTKTDLFYKMLILLLTVTAALSSDACSAVSGKEVPAAAAADIPDLSALPTGEEVTFGTYEQDGDPSDGPEDLHWFVIDQRDEGTWLLSASLLACKPYHSPIRDITWKESSLRAWLNQPFLTQAFSDEEQPLLQAVMNDKVFLLSSQEYSACFSSEELIWLYGRAAATPQAQAEGVDVNEEGFASWWLRSPGNEDYSAQFVEEDGHIFEGGAEADIDYAFGVRPVICLKNDPVH